MRVTAVVDLSYEGEIAVVTIDNPPVNALSADVRDGVFGALQLAIANNDTTAIILICAGRTFVAGGDIGALGTKQGGAPMREIAGLMEASPKPVIIAIHGSALGGGFELSLAAHWRIATPTARVGLPEVKLGILPGAGGTQRLPRLVGAEKALEMIIFGETINAEDALQAGALDALVEGRDLRGEAIAFARQVVAERRPLRRAKDAIETVEAGRANPGQFDAFVERHAETFRGALAPAACLRAVRAAFESPFEAGLDLERELTNQLIPSLQSKALRHIFFAERAAFKIAGAPASAELSPIRTVGVLAATPDGLADARAFAGAGLEVLLFDTDAARLASAPAIAGVAKTDDPAQLSACDVVLDPTFGPHEPQRARLVAITGRLARGAIVSSLALEHLADRWPPAQLLGVHFFYPGDQRKFLEVVRTDATSPATAARVAQLLRRMGKLAVFVKPDPIGVATRAMSARQVAAEDALIGGAASPYAIDAALHDFGFTEGVFQWEDRLGLGVSWIRTGRGGDVLRARLCAAGRTGQAAGLGFYDYPAGATPTVSDDVLALVAEVASTLPREPRLEGQALALRLLAPIVNEAAKMLQDGLVQRASDADLMWVAGFGWPAYHGGPLFYAEHEAGLAAVTDALERLAGLLGAEHAPCPLLKALAEQNKGFADV